MDYLDVKSSGTSLNIHVYETVTSSVINSSTPLQASDKGAWLVQW